MRRERSNWNKASLTRAAFVCAALVLALALLGTLGTALFRRRAEQAENTRPDRRNERVVAWFGSTADPFCAPLYPAMEKVCRDNGWRLISYDCRGRTAGQLGQIDDFLRTEQADAAVIYSLLEKSDLNRQVKRLAEVCPVVTVGQQVGMIAGSSVAAHIGANEAEQVGALAEYLAENMEKEQGALLMTTVPDKAAERRYVETFSQGDVTVLDNNYTWGGQVYAERYLNTALEAFPETGAIICVSRHGAAGALKTLEEWGRRDSVKIVSLFYEKAMADDLTQGVLDAAVAFSPKEAGERLAEVLPGVLKGGETTARPLTPVLLTRENVEETESWYE